MQQQQKSKHTKRKKNLRSLLITMELTKARHLFYVKPQFKKGQLILVGSS